MADLKSKVIRQIGLNIKKLRKDKDLTQESLAEAADLSEKHLSAVENGRLENVSIGYLIDIATALGTDYKVLLENT